MKRFALVSGLVLLAACGGSAKEGSGGGGMPAPPALYQRLGGIDVVTTHPVLDDEYPADVYSRFPFDYQRVAVLAGPQHLDGIHAMQYVRSRHGDLQSDFGRSQRQQQVLLAIRQKAKQINPEDIPNLAAAIGGEVKTLRPGEGLFIASGNTVMLKAGDGGPSTLLHFLLAPTADLDRPLEAPPAVVQELYRTVAPRPALKPGSYDLNLTRVTFPAEMPSNSPHHRSGAALYYILSGTGANTVEGKVEARTSGSLIYEPSDLVHQWGNPGNVPLTFLAFNINPDGVAAVLPAVPAKRE